MTKGILAAIVANPAIKLAGTSFSFSGEVIHIIIPPTKRTIETTNPLPKLISTIVSLALLINITAIDTKSTRQTAPKTAPLLPLEKLHAKAIIVLLIKTVPKKTIIRSPSTFSLTFLPKLLILLDKLNKSYVVNSATEIPLHDTINKGKRKTRKVNPNGIPLINCITIFPILGEFSVYSDIDVPTFKAIFSLKQAPHLSQNFDPSSNLFPQL